MNADQEPSTVGWDAIDATLEQLYPDQEPRHVAPALPGMFGGNDPIDGISIYRRDRTGSAAHWHFVSYGMSELYAKESDDAEVSGWGFEFTFRLQCKPGEDQAPGWPFHVLQNLARYVRKSGNTFAPGHYLPMNGPIALGVDTAIHAGMFTEDPELKEIETPNGRLQFLQLVGSTMDELAAARAWDTAKLLEVMRKDNPLLVTDLARTTILKDPAAARLVVEGTARDGSTTGQLYVRELAIEDIASGATRAIRIKIGASNVSDIQALLRGRISFGRDFSIVGPNAMVKLTAAKSFALKTEDAGRQVSINFPADVAIALADVLVPQRGDYFVQGIPQFNLRVVPTQIMDHTGKHVVKVIG